jgi:hypothetical protein
MTGATVRNTGANRLAQPSQPPPRGLRLAPVKGAYRMVPSVCTEIKKSKKVASHDL